MQHRALWVVLGGLVVALGVVLLIAYVPRTDPSGDDVPRAGRTSELSPEAPALPEGAPRSDTEWRELLVPNPVPAPDFSLQTLDGSAFRLGSHLGKVVVLNFWATWCGPCLVEIPEFVQMQRHLRGDVVFAGVSLDEEAGPGEIREFAEALKVNYPVMLDDGSAHLEYGPITSLPTTFVIDRVGLVRAYIPGMVMRATLQPMLEYVLAETAQ